MVGGSGSSMNELSVRCSNSPGYILFVVFAERKEANRLIPARLAANAEMRLYYDQDINY